VNGSDTAQRSLWRQSADNVLKAVAESVGNFWIMIAGLILLLGFPVGGLIA
jgi:hypothetical protein